VLEKLEAGNRVFAPSFSKVRLLSGPHKPMIAKASLHSGDGDALVVLHVPFEPG
jgi:hypothetical protein